MASEAYFRFNIVIVKLAGLWQPSYNVLWKNTLHYVYNVVIVTFTFAFHYGTEVAFILASPYDIQRVFTSITWLATHTIAIFKAVLWWIKWRKILGLIATMDSEEYLYEPCDNFDPDGIMKRNNKINTMYLSFHFTFGQMIPLLSCVGAIAAIFSAQNHGDEFVHNNQTQYVNFPFATYILWDTESHMKCILAIIVQGLGIATFGFVIISLDGMFTSSVSFVTAHCHVLYGAFESLLPRALKKLNKGNDVMTSKNLDEQVNLEMNKCVKHLQMLISATDQIENIYRFQTLALALVTLFEVCNNLFLLSSVSVASPDFLGPVTFIVTAGIEFSSYCWFGNELTLAYADIPESLYNSDWILFDEKVKRTMLLTMTRMTRPVMLSLGKFSPLTLNTLVSTLRASYSFFAVLKQMNDES